jgi:hypothetical protein
VDIALILDAYFSGIVLGGLIVSRVHRQSKGQ